MICDEPRFAFVHIPKSAGTSIYSGLFKACQNDGRVLLSFDNFHATVDDIIPFRGRYWLETATVFSTIRNPWARAYSIWKFRLEKSERLVRVIDKGLVPRTEMTRTELEETAENMRTLGFNHWLRSDDTDVDTFGVPLVQKSQLSWLRTEDGASLATKVIKVEDMDMGFLGRFGINEVKVLNASPSEHHYRDVFDTESRKFIEKYFEEDIEFGQYCF